MTLAPKSRRARWIVWLPKTIEIVGQPGSLHLRGTWFDIIKLTLDVKNALLGTFVALLVVHRSFRKQA